MDKKTFDPSKFVDHLVSVANKDGIYSEDEKNLIKVVETEVRQYSFELNKAMADGILDKGEKLSLMNQRLVLVRKVFDTVQKDMKITMDEQDIMDALMSRLNELSDHETD